MGRYIGPKHKMCRRLGMRVCSTDKCSVLRRAYPSGQHGPKRRARITEYGKQMLEKQKARFMYGLREQQFRNLFERAMHAKGQTNQKLLELLERRFDNVIYRTGLAKTRAQARQYVSHGLFQLNGKKLDIPSAQVEVGDKITVKRKRDLLLDPLKKGKKTKDLPSWISAEVEQGAFTVTSLPGLEDLPREIDATLIVEFYSR